MVAPTNPNVTYNTIGQIGVGLNKRTNTTTETNPAEFALGTTVIDTKGFVWVYVQTQVGKTVKSNSYVTLSWNTVQVSSVVSKTINVYVNGTAPFNANDYGWVQAVRRLGYASPIQTG